MKLNTTQARVLLRQVIEDGFPVPWETADPAEPQEQLIAFLINNAVQLLDAYDIMYDIVDCKTDSKGLN